MGCMITPAIFITLSNEGWSLHRLSLLMSLMSIRIPSLLHDFPIIFPFPISEPQGQDSGIENTRLSVASIPPGKIKSHTNIDIPVLMTAKRSYLIPRFVGLIVFAIFILFFQKTELFSSSYSDVVGMSDPAITSLKVTVRQVSSSPPTLAIGVTNTHSSAVTILSWSSPLDPLAVKLGLLSFHPAGSDGPVEIPTIMVRRKMPPGPESLVTIEPGQTKEQEVELKRPVVPLDKLQGKVGVICHGEWMGVWASRVDEVSGESLEKLGIGEDGSKQKFESQQVEIDI